MSNRRKLKGGRPSKLKGRAMTSTPTLDTTRRWLKAAEADGDVRRGPDRRTGEPGRPAHQWELTKAGRERVKSLPPLEIMRQQIRRQENARKKRAQQRDAAGRRPPAPGDSAT